MASTPASNLIDVLKNIVLACEANGLRDLPFVRDGRRIIDSRSSDPASELIKELRNAAKMEDQPHVQQDHAHADLLRKAADTLEAIGSPTTPVGWETKAEWEMEQQLFHACGRADVPKDVQKLIGQLWKLYCHAAAPKELEIGAQTPDLSDDHIELARAIYLSKVEEYDRDFMRDDKPEGFWQEKYGTNLHATSLGEQWAMRQALNAVLAAIGIVKVDQQAAAEGAEHKAVAIAKMLFERMDFNLRINDLWSDAAKEMAVYILSAENNRETAVSKCFIVDYTVDDNAADTKLFDYHTQQPQAEAFCKSVKDRGGAVNIKTREVGSAR
ncbi:hypothetical protein OIU34_20580 [Pararhizobium sp. BT-229]|uniref:hypothetical protein n=1 Tax=Pararhizobium sp. BT-229 TaxID=2986923 RepID=UPI0021F7EA1D|nr:hypothetical protein [Pararhizobium sp. BT-229]MCV9964286.1 hypothetical protein [Pararhizobium sp. BT-229]